MPREKKGYSLKLAVEFPSSVVFVDGTESDINTLPISTEILSIYAELSHHFHFSHSRKGNLAN